MSCGSEGNRGSGRKLWQPTARLQPDCLETVISCEPYARLAYLP